MTDTQYYSLLTSSGHQANIKAKALGLPIVISKVAFGSGNITPTESATALVKEEIRVNINSIIQNETDKNILEIEAVIPSDVGGFLVNEAALYLEDGTLYAVANLPASYKPSLDQGAGKEFAFTIFLASVGVENVTLKIDDSIVFATRKYVQNEFKKYAFKNGDKTQIFKVKDAVEDDEAVNKKQLDVIAQNVSNAISNIQFLPIGTVFGGYEDDNPNFIVAFGGTFKKADYPKLWTYASTHPNRLKTLAQWDAEAIANSGICDYYCEVDSLNFRVPNLDGSTIKFSSRAVGSFEGDAIRNIKGVVSGLLGAATSGTSGAFLPESLGVNYTGNGNAYTYSKAHFNSSNVVPTAPRNRVENTAQKPLIVAK
ncbi:phage tail protein [Aliarcobacter butzleri]|uniref:phage tail protein n=1 Tax=Aliarcobacter butzleri TaxID=28197 RepID=UPI001EDD191D|nr:phage tail protein [Aliarcobacter butzleri]MCG3698882.1 phage tail protein [Aliarcobacter butzleri]